MAELGQLAETARTWRAEGALPVLATVVEASGSVYRGVGAKILLGVDGRLSGTLSGGCLEGDLAVTAEQCLADGQARRRRFDLSEEEMWSLGLGCGGRLEVQLEPLWEGGPVDRPAIWQQVEAEERTWVVASRGSGRAAAMAVEPSGAALGSLGDPTLDQAAREAARTLFAAQGSVRGGRNLTVEGVPLFLDLLQPPPALWVFGAGHDSLPLVELAARVGFSVRVVDPRPAFAVPERFPQARQVLRRWPEELGPEEPPPGSYAVILHHHLERDAAALKVLMGRRLRYLGVLGPLARTERLLERLAAEGAQVAGALERLHAPLGLDLGARGPEEVAVAAVAELLAVREGRRGGFLKGQRTPLHGPNPE